MKCEEFRQLMTSSEGNEAELEKHLTGCQACDAWLQKELASPPTGLTPAQWQEATARCFPEKLPETATANEPQSFWHFFFNGLKYGMVFGLSLITGFALIDHLGPAAEPTSVENVELISFIDDTGLELPDFYENDDLDVTFYDDQESKYVSFLPKVQIQSFYEIDKEEETWNENSG